MSPKRLTNLLQGEMRVAAAEVIKVIGGSKPATVQLKWEQR
jgi:hypothetical protein